MVWDTATGRLIAALEGPRADELTGAWFAPDGERILTSSSDGTLRMWSVPAPTGYVDTATPSVEGVASLAWSPDGRQLAMASDDHGVGIWDATTGAPQQTLTDHSDSVYAVAFSPDGTLLGSAGADRTIKIWDVATGKRLYSLS
jgi:WD40 repeat protein